MHSQIWLTSCISKNTLCVLTPHFQDISFLLKLWVGCKEWIGTLFSFSTCNKKFVTFITKPPTTPTCGGCSISPYFFLVAYFLMWPLKLGFVMLARVLCESVSTHLIFSRGKLTTREVTINGFFANKFRHFLTKIGKFSKNVVFFHVPQLFPITSV
jgi:hypothetical protein